MEIIELRQQAVKNKCENCRGIDRVEKKQNVNRRNVLHLIYYASFVLLVTILIVQVSFSIDAYSKKPTYTVSYLVPQHDVEFPALSICSTSNVYKADNLKVRLYNSFHSIFSVMTSY